jgi:hypothetical protein
VVTVGDTIEPHGEHTAPSMVEGESWFRVGGRATCRAEHRASCGHATTGRQWFRLTSAKNGYRQYVKSASWHCNPEHIPWIMRAHGWYEGAKLMDQWFSGEASTTKDKKYTDFSTISMDFVLGYADAKAKYDGLVNTNLWSIEQNGDSTLARLCRRLQKDGLLTNKREVFNYLSLSKDDFTVQDLKGLQIDSQSIRSESKPPLDGLTAALGNFELLLFAAGVVEPAGNDRYRIEVEQTGVLVEDQFDFAGIQFLGWWDIDRHYVNNEPLEDHGNACRIWNLDFQIWRLFTGLGRDYWIYSDLKITNVDPVAVFYCFVTQ